MYTVVCLWRGLTEEHLNDQNFFITITLFTVWELQLYKIYFPYLLDSSNNNSNKKELQEEHNKSNKVYFKTTPAWKALILFLILWKMLIIYELMQTAITGMQWIKSDLCTRLTNSASLLIRNLILIRVFLGKFSS